MTDTEYEAENRLWQEWVRTMRAHDEWIRVLDSQTTPKEKA